MTTELGWDPQPDEEEADWDERSLFQIWWPILLVVAGGFALVGLVFVLPISVFARELGELDLWGDASAPCEDPSAPLWFSAGEGDTAELTQMLDAGAAGPDMVDASLDGWTPLLCAADHHRTATASALLDAGADPDLATGGRAAPIAIAAGDGNLALVEQLLDAGADPDNNATGTTALTEAEQYGHTEVADRLRAAGATNPTISSEG